MYLRFYFEERQYGFRLPFDGNWSGKVLDALYDKVFALLGKGHFKVTMMTDGMVKVEDKTVLAIGTWELEEA